MTSWPETLPDDPDASGIVLAGSDDDSTVAAAIARVTADDLAPAQRRGAVGQLAKAFGRRGYAQFLRPKAAINRLADIIIDVAPRIPLRSLSTLRGHFPGRTDDEIADRLIRTAVRATAVIGAAGGGVAAIEWAVPPTLLGAPALLAAETVAVVSVEIKLIGELQELHGQAVPGGQAQRAITLLQAWAGRRGVNLMVPGRGLAAAMSTAARYELRDRLMRRFGRNLTTLGPMLTGAAVAAMLNRRATLRLAQEVRADLDRFRRQQPAGD